MKKSEDIKGEERGKPGEGTGGKLEEDRDIEDGNGDREGKDGGENGRGIEGKDGRREGIEI